MIKSEELMLGNWIRLFLGIDDNGKNYRNYKIEGIMNQHGSSFHLVSNTWIEISNNFEPIPLTEELLLKCGFEHSDGSYSIDFNDRIIEVWDDFKGNNRVLTDDDDIFIYTLHHLQNYVFIKTGKHLEIEL